MNKTDLVKRLDLDLDKKYINIIFIIFLIIFANFIIFYKLGTNWSLFAYDEARHAEDALEILKTGDWIVMHYAGVPDMYLVKPPLGVYFTAISFLIFGVNEFAIRFFSAFFAVITILLVYFFGKDVRNNLTGFISALAFMGIPQFLGFHGARTGDFDILVTFFITLSIYCFYKYMKKPNKYLLIGTGVSLAAVTLIKQIIVVIPILIILIYLSYSKSFKKINKYDFIHTLITYLVLVSPWFILRSLRGKDFLIKMVTFDIIRRSTTVIEDHISGPFFYFQTIYQNLSIPILIILIFGIIFITYLSFNNKNRKNIDFLFIIYIIIFLFMLSLAKTRIFWYLIPIYPAICIIIGLTLNDLKRYFNINTFIFLLIILLLIINPIINSYTQSHLYYYKTNEKNIADHFKSQLNLNKDVYTYEYDYYPQSLFFYISKETKGTAFIFNDSSKINAMVDDLAIISNIYITRELEDKGFIEVDSYENYYLLKKTTLKNTTILNKPEYYIK